ncbi:MAG: hypothetical protein HY695_00200 [Deltaproteobacteria bacterium]|nr:hypothetical protein [Deltaproteobacteria bacterium]
MTEPAKRARKAPTLTRRVTEMELAFKPLQEQLVNALSRLESQSERVSAMELELSSEIGKIRSTLQEKTSAGADFESTIVLEEGSALNLEELERALEQRCALLVSREEELLQMQKELSAELKELSGAIRERDVVWAAREMELRNLKQNMQARIEGLERRLRNKEIIRQRRPRLVWFLADIGRKT